MPCQHQVGSLHTEANIYCLQSTSACSVLFPSLLQLIEPSSSALRYPLCCLAQCRKSVHKCVHALLSIELLLSSNVKDLTEKPQRTLVSLLTHYCSPKTCCQSVGGSNLIILVKPASDATGMCTASPACTKTFAQLLQAQAGMMAGLNRQQRHELYRQVSDNTLAHMLAAMRSQERTKLLREVEEVDQSLVDRVLRYIRCSVICLHYMTVKVYLITIIEGIATPMPWFVLNRTWGRRSLNHVKAWTCKSHLT